MCIVDIETEEAIYYLQTTLFSAIICFWSKNYPNPGFLYPKGVLLKEVGTYLNSSSCSKSLKKIRPFEAFSFIQRGELGPETSTTEN